MKVRLGEIYGVPGIPQPVTHVGQMDVQLAVTDLIRVGNVQSQDWSWIIYPAPSGPYPPISSPILLRISAASCWEEVPEAEEEGVRASRRIFG